MRRRTTVLAASFAALLAATGTTYLLTAPAASAATTYGVAPYVDMSNSGESLLDTAIAQAGVHSYTAAFIIGTGCTPIWGDSQTIDNSTANAEIARAQSEGAKTIISFGGAAGAELAQSCTSTSSLAAAYQSVITKYKVDHIDFDVEGAAIADTGSINRRFQAINTLEANNPGLNVSLTIPVLRSGPDYNGSAFLVAAKNNGTRIDLVNAMTMDYGGSGIEMGDAAVSAAQGTLTAARAAWPSYSYANIGITPMIGQNDSAGEIFTLADAQKVVSFANSGGVGRLAFWSVSRDQQCAGGSGGGASPICSSVSQSQLQFTKIFTAYAGGGGGTGPTTGPTTSSPTPTKPSGSCTAAAWSAGAVYTGGMAVSYNGHQYQAKWWTQGDQPNTHSGTDDVWKDLGACSGGGGTTTSPTPTPTHTASPTPTATGAFTQWAANHSYAIGDKVSYAGHNYQCIQAHTSIVGWEPPHVPALWKLL